MSNIHNSVLRYNGWDIPFLKTERFHQEPTWSADGTDLLCTHVTIAVSGILHKTFLNNTSPSEWIEKARTDLLQRGGQLYFYVGGIQIIPPAMGNGVTPATGSELTAAPVYYNPDNQTRSALVNAGLDARLGPKPIRLDVRAIRGDCFTIYYEIETWIPYCDTTPQAILSNRWESSLDIDKDYFYTRTTNGTLVLNGQQLQNQATTFVTLANATSLILPPLLPGWKRDTVRMVMSSDNLTLTYSIVDRQQYVSLPRPAVRIDASYAEVMPPAQLPQGGISMALMNLQQINMDVMVEGDPSVQIPNSYPTAVGDGTYNPDQLKYALMKIMFQIVFSRIQFPFIASGTAFGNNEFITHFELREDLMKPVVGCRIVALKTRTQTANQFGSSAVWQTNVFDATMVGKPLLLDDMLAQVNTQPISIGNFATFLFVQAVAPKDPCAASAAPLLAGQIGTPGTQVYTSQTATAESTPGSAYSQTVNLSYSNANYRYPFTEYSASVDFVTDNHYIQAPVMYDVEQGVGSGTTLPSSVFCQTASPTSKKVIHWKASRLGDWPKAPRPDAVDVYGGGMPSDKVLNYVISPGEVELSNDGLTRHYSIAGVYEIGMARRVQWDVPGTVLSTVCNPIIGSSVYGDADASYPTTYIVNGLLDTGSSPGDS